MKIKVTLLLCIAMTFALPAFADNLLADSDFNILGPSGSPTVNIGQNHGVDSAAANWGQWNNNATLTTSALVNIPTPEGDNTALQITTNATDSGVYQFFTPSNQGTDVASVVVYVLTGQVGIAFVNADGTYTLAPTSSTTGQWEELTATGNNASGEFVIYSSGGAADFYVDGAYVSAVPEPGSLLTFGTGLLGLAGVIRRRLCR